MEKEKKLGFGHIGSSIIYPALRFGHLSLGRTLVGTRYKLAWRESLKNGKKRKGKGKGRS